MRTLFLLHEQRLLYFLEPSYLELYLPMTESGLLGETSIHVYQREMRWLRDTLSRQPAGDRAPEDPFKLALFNLLRQKVLEFRPELVIYALTWPHECIPTDLLSDLKADFGFKLCSVIWDHDESNPALQQIDREVIAASDLTIVADSLSRTQRIRERSDIYASFTNTDNAIFLPMVPAPSVFHPGNGPIHDVTISGSSEGFRTEVFNALVEGGIRVHRSGGMMQGDAFLGHAEYARDLAMSRIVVNTQTMGSRIQVKGRVAQCLAAGTFLLEQDNQESRLYLENIPVTYWTSIEDLKAKIAYFLRDEPARSGMARAAHLAWAAKYNVRNFTSTIVNRVRQTQR